MQPSAPTQTFSYEKVMVFIDGSNLFHALRRANVKIDYRKMLDELVAGRNLVQPFFFGSVPPNPTASQIAFQKTLQMQGFEVKIFPLRSRDGRLVEKGVDVALAVEFLVQAFNKNYDVGILVSGDEDFRGVVGEAKRLGRKVEIASFRASTSAAFQICGNRFIALDDLLPKIKLL